MRAWIEAKAKATCDGYPIAIVTYYGPSDTFISHVVVSIISHKNTEADLVSRMASLCTSYR